MKVYLVTFPGAYFKGWSIVVASSRDSALFYVMNKRETLANRPYDRNFENGTITENDFHISEIDAFEEGIQYFYSGDT